METNTPPCPKCGYTNAHEVTCPLLEGAFTTPPSEPAKREARESSMSLAIIAKHWIKALPPEAGYIDLPFNLECACREIDSYVQRLERKFDALLESAKADAQAWMKERDQLQRDLEAAREELRNCGVEIDRYMRERNEANERIASLEKKHADQYAHDTKALHEVHRERDAARADVERLKALEERWLKTPMSAYEEQAKKELAEERADAAEKRVRELETQVKRANDECNETAKRGWSDHKKLARAVEALERISGTVGRQTLNTRTTGPEAMRIAREALKEIRGGGDE